MTAVYVCNTAYVGSSDFDRLLNLLPPFMHNEVMRYQQQQDRNARLLARAMLYDCLHKEGCAALLECWEKAPAGRPYIQGYRHFNISHAGELVTLVVADEPAGIDVEKVVAIDVDPLLINFSPQERLFIETHENKYHAFYQSWVKKEAFLKAVGTGLTDDIAQFDCSGDVIEAGAQRWYFHHLAVQTPGYHCCLCTATGNKPPEPVFTAPGNIGQVF